MKKELYRHFRPYESIYRNLHPRTADMDILIVVKFSQGKNAVRIAMEVPCAEATVYRAVKRIENFILDEIKPYEDVRLSLCGQKEKS